MDKKPKFEICQLDNGRLCVTVRSLSDMLSKAMTDADQEYDIRVWLAVRNSLSKLAQEFVVSVAEFCQGDEDKLMQFYKML